MKALTRLAGRLDVGYEVIRRDKGAPRGLTRAARRAEVPFPKIRMTMVGYSWGSAVKITL